MTWIDSCGTCANTDPAICARCPSYPCNRCAPEHRGPGRMTECHPLSSAPCRRPLEALYQDAPAARVKCPTS
jgi:hypothetical protein